MLFQKIVFGPCGKDEDAAHELVISYLRNISWNGQTDDSSRLVVQDGTMTAYVNATGVDAWRKKFHCHSGKQNLKKIITFFGQEPEWIPLEDIRQKRDITWKNAPFLYLEAQFCGSESPVVRGDDGMSIPYYRLPSSYAISSWWCGHKFYDSIWMGYSEMVTAYRHLADPASSLSEHGREICRKIEAITGVPTYYCLKRYYGRKKAEEETRKCPGCGKAWRTEYTADDPHFYHFAFQCEPCRLVSHLPDHVNARYAKIGDFTGKKVELEPPNNSRERSEAQ